MTAEAAETALDRKVVDLEPAHSDTAADEADRAARRRSFRQGQHASNSRRARGGTTASASVTATSASSGGREDSRKPGAEDAVDSVELNAPGATTVADGDDTEESSDTDTESRLPGVASQSTPSSAGSTVRPTSRRLPRRSNAATGTNNWNAVTSVALA